MYIIFWSFFSIQGFILFSFFQICWFEKGYEKMSQRPYPQPQLIEGLVFADLFGYFGPSYVK